MSLPIGTVRVAVAGSRYPLCRGGRAVLRVTVKARSGNTGLVYVGDEGVSSSNGYCLGAGEEVFLGFRDALDLRRIYVTGDTAGDRVDYAGAAR